MIETYLAWLRVMVKREAYRSGFFVGNVLAFLVYLPAVFSKRYCTWLRNRVS